MSTARRIEKMSRVLKNRQHDLTVVCENIHDPHNVSAILRTCDAVGIADVQLLYTNREFPKLGKKSSASAKKWIDANQFQSPAALRESLKKRGLTIYATHLSTENPRSIYEVDWRKPSAIVLGNEHLGISEEALAMADHNVYIPMFGMIQSLNVSVAAAVILYEVCRQRIAAGMYPRPDIDPGEFNQKLAEWQEK